MKRLSGADSFMLGMETSKAYMHTFKVAIIDPSTDPDGWSFERFYEESAKRIHHVPMLRWKYLDSPLGLNHPIITFAVWLARHQAITVPCANSCRQCIHISSTATGRCGWNGSSKDWLMAKSRLSCWCTMLMSTALARPG